VESIKAEIELSSPSRRQRILEALALAALGSILELGRDCGSIGYGWEISRRRSGCREGGTVSGTSHDLEDLISVAGLRNCQAQP